MKKLLLICLIIFTCANANAQVFATPGSTWWYYANNSEYEGTFKYTLTGTDSTGKINYVHLYGRVFPKNPDYLPWTQSDNLKLYVSNDSVYSMYGNTKYLEYTFDANTGDSIPLYLVNCDNVLKYSYLHVDNKYDTLLYGQTLRVLKVRSRYCSTSEFSSQSLIIEKIGTINSDFLPIRRQRHLICYSSDGLSFTQYGLINCDSATYILSNNSSQLDFIKVSPNPTAYVLKIEGIKTAYSYIIFDVSGQRVLQSNGIGNTIDVSNLINGLYLLRVQLPNGYSQVFKVFKN